MKAILFLLWTLCFINAEVQSQNSIPQAMSAGAAVSFLADIAVPPSYSSRRGSVFLKNGETLEGTIQIRTRRISIESRSIDKEHYRFEELDSLKILASVGKSYETFIYLREEKYDDLYRILYKGKRDMILTNFYSLGEKAELPNDFKQILYRDSDLYAKQSWKSIRSFYPEDEDYVDAVPDLAGKYKNTFGILNSFVILLDQRDPSLSHQWQDSEITMKSGEVKKGHAFCQPYYPDPSSTSEEAYVHFFDGKSFHVYTNNEVDRLRIGETEFYPLYLKDIWQYVFVKDWLYNGITYKVILKMSGPFYYLYDDNKYLNRKDFIIAEDHKKDKIKISGDQKDLISAYLKELRSGE